MLGHSDVAPGRKLDPGEAFPWERLHEAGVGHWVPPAADQRRPLLRPRRPGHARRGPAGDARHVRLSDCSITGVFDEDTEKVVAAFQRHFRPERVDGVADASTITTLRDLIARRPQPRTYDKELTRT